ncbi:MAG: bifunctional [glutamate--ammonia ligase]-adenylyl-L-tyrosine phosphorylase/[glutamate--ammonia-ligase] adenylyltransferase [Candidatus Dadabacteria bacterium]|nr:bifunctional [glutamate--ammonia ligase]-adenylyl-L-tyrosine phosphorylase/[glutamate--ammonia-ligase] adenylyltransferase [Candidatus Dadabacteria bacterium]
MNKPLPDPGYARTVLEHYKESHKKISPARKKILELLAGYSYFLGRAAVKDPGILEYIESSGAVSDGKTPAAFMEEAGGIAASSETPSQLESALRRYKYRELGRIIWRDITGGAPFTETMEELSDLASAIVEAAITFHRPEAEGAGEFTVIGMGKLGGRELNLSSDIDIIYMYREDGDPDPFFRLAEKVTKSLSAVTEDGFLYRVDLGLRPGGGKSTIAVSLEGALEHYFYWGDTWERAAMIKARPVAGDISLGEKFVSDIEPFVYKKFLDYSSIEDLKDMKTRLDQLEKKRDVKLGKGGIREIEFFVQALALVNGGEIKYIRENNTLRALGKLEAMNLIAPEIRRTLSDSYLFLRKVEHNIQLADERQTHRLPSSPDDLEKLALRTGIPDRDELERLYREKTSAVSSVYKGLFYEPSQKTEEVGNEFWKAAGFLMEGNLDEGEAVENLRALGFRNPGMAADILSKLLDVRKGGLTQGGRAATRKVIPAFLASVLKSPDPDLAIVNLERFVSGIGWRTSLYSVLAENPDIIELLVKLFSTSGYLSNFLIRHPEYMDVITLRDVRTEYSSKGEMLAQIRQSLAEEDDYGSQLDVLRRFRHVETLKICLRDLNGEVGPFYVGKYLSMVAEAVLEAGLDIAWGVVRDKEERPEKNHRMVVMGMGKLGGKELSYNSDLDVIFIYDGREEEHMFYSKLGQKVISVLSVPTGEGYAYKMDMGLRPSGRSGALVTSFNAFRKYQQESAQIWERQALVKAAPSAGNTKVGNKVMKLVTEFVYERPLREGFEEEIKRLRKRMEKELAAESREKLNIKTGRGGIVDIEFLVQMLQLKYGGEHPEVRRQNTSDALAWLHEAGIIGEGDYTELSGGLMFLRKMENLLRLLHDRSINELYESDFEKLATELEPGDGAKLRRKYTSTTGKIRKIYSRYFSGRTADTAPAERRRNSK